MYQTIPTLRGLKNSKHFIMTLGVCRSDIQEEGSAGLGSSKQNSQPVAGAAEVWSSRGLTKHLPLSFYICALSARLPHSTVGSGLWNAWRLQDTLFHPRAWAFQLRRQKPHHLLWLNLGRPAELYILLVTSELQICPDSRGGEVDSTSWWGSNKVLESRWDGSYSCGSVGGMPSTAGALLGRI